MLYVNFKRWSVSWDEAEKAFSLTYDSIGTVARSIRLEGLETMTGVRESPDVYDVAVRTEKQAILAEYSGARENRRDLILRFLLSDAGAELSLSGDGGANFCLTGLLPMGDAGKARMAVRLEGQDAILRGAVGPAVPADCDAVFAPELDAAVTLDTLGERRIAFDFAKGCYAFTYQSMHRDYSKQLTFQIRESLYRREFHLDDAPLGPAGKGKLPVGWMSWYAVQFNACEETVLRNARFQAKELAAYGANTIWVDWEWYHRDFTGLEKRGTDMFHPDKDAYPHGLEAVAREIARLGFTPALWIGPTCDAAYNEVIAAHPELVLEKKPSWCGQYFLDPSHPVFLNEILPRMIGQAKAWGYKAIKWDVMPATAAVCDRQHDRLWRKELSTRQIMKNAYQRARELLGEETYMLYCSGGEERDVDLATGSFDAMRIGGDIFGWQGFISQCVDRLYDTYPLHGVSILCDPDNVILREEFNTMDQAITRASLVSLMGLPFTLGDDLPELPPERIDILRKCMPPLPAKPVEIRRMRRQTPQGLLHVRVEKEFGGFDLVDVYNLSDAPGVYRLRLAADLGLDGQGAYHLYDFWRDAYIGPVSGDYTVELRPCESRVLAIHPVSDRPQLLSTSRHVSQGALEIQALRWRENTSTLEGVSQTPVGASYALIVAAPASYRPLIEAEEIAPRVWRVCLTPEAEETAWQIPFARG